ncbi:MAPEG family protein [Gluconacetobacter tumulisoli]|uniref:MAPEG family protein n=1 Tax=Gluconacetobacter tumulisoli TaxID=1286189 RepID=A0A7W4PJX1_9PROT|nr:MAPEG family protein [Gluconacetobacter tumulisoli]MBB2200812.1 MAPEG family protein [Gluconacetobacter tumulisoli]
MTSELWALLWSAILCLVLPALYGPLYSRQIGQAGVIGNREDVPPPTGAAGRGLRAHRNLIENLVPFAIAVLVARAAGISNGMTVLGAWLFLGARVVHAASYIAGITGLRTLAWIVGAVGIVLIIVQIF